MTPPTVNAYYSSIDNKIGTYNGSGARFSKVPFLVDK